MSEGGGSAGTALPSAGPHRDLGWVKRDAAPACLSERRR